jgi:outer membrane protein assembly factor BamB
LITLLNQSLFCDCIGALVISVFPPVSAIPVAVFSGSLDGHLRAYASETGVVIWDAHTATDFKAVNGPAHGGSLDVAGPVIAGGMVYVVWLQSVGRQAG